MASLKYDYDAIYKILFVGGCKTGKTSIIKKFIFNEFNNDGEFPTFYVDFYEKNIRKNDEVYRLHIWDLSGNERHINDYQCTCYKNVHCCILVFDVTNTFSFITLDKWIQEIKKNNANTYIILVGNKIDYEDDIEVTDDMIRQYLENKNIAYFATSAKNGTNIDKLFSFTCQLINKKPSIIKKFVTAPKHSNHLIESQRSTNFIDVISSTYNSLSEIKFWW
jgi:small GTP-binding protein